MEAQSHTHRVQRPTETAVPVRAKLESPRIVFTVVRAQLHAASCSVDIAVENALQLFVGIVTQPLAEIYRIDDAGPAAARKTIGIHAAVEVYAFGLKPIALMRIVIRCRGQTEVGGYVEAVTQNRLLVLGRDII